VKIREQGRRGKLPIQREEEKRKKEREVGASCTAAQNAAHFKIFGVKKRKNRFPFQQKMRDRFRSRGKGKEGWSMGGGK